jgi:hypothetical protein
VEAYDYMALRIKQLKIGSYGLSAFLIIVVATLLRLVLIAQGWPHTNADEGTMGIMGLHIANNGARPIFFYGQNYMGTLEAYIAAAFFHFFGASVFTLRLGLVLIYALFLTNMYLLASLLYSKKLALVTLVLLTLGSSLMLDTELVAIGGYPELLFFGSLALLLATWLVLSLDQYSTSRNQWWRLAAYGLLGLIIGLGFWSDFLMLTFILITSLLLAVFCWRELLEGALLVLAFGLLIGVFPLIVYNLHASHGENTLNVLYYLHNTGFLELAKLQAQHRLPFEPQLRGTLLISLPAATGGVPFCYDTNLMQTGYTSFQNVPCPLLINNLRVGLLALIWSMGFILLWVISFAFTMRNLWKLRVRMPAEHRTHEEHQEIKRQFSRLMLLCSGGLVLLLFILSPSSAVFPGNSRYLVGLLISTPALIAPLFGLASVSRSGTAGAGNNDSTTTHNWFKVTSLRTVIGSAILMIIGVVLLAGTLKTFMEIPSVQANNQQQETLIRGLLHIKANHIYTDYWTCDSTAFLSGEQIICATVDGQQKVTLRYSRYKPYIKVVESDPNSVYVFPIQAGQVPSLIEHIVHSHGGYQRFVFGEYVVYQPAISR